VRRVVLWLLRTFRPVQAFRDVTLVTRFDGVQEALSRHQDFSVRLFGSRMRETGADFFLGHDEEPPFRALRDAAAAAIGALGPDRPREIARRAARELVEARLVEGCGLDVVADLGEPVHLRLVEEWLGIPDPGSRVLLEWVQLVSYYVFNPLPTVANAGRAVAAGAKLRDYVSRSMQAPPEVGSVAAALLARRLPAGGLADTMVGLVAGALGPGPRLFPAIVDRLLRLRGSARSELCEAARKDDETRVRAYVVEAARLAPEPSLVIRACEGSHTIAGRPIAPGSTVVCLLDSALRDRRRFERPRRFHPGRCTEPLLHLGTGLHACIGRDAGLAAITAMTTELFSLAGLERAPGWRGRLRTGAPGTHPGQDYPKHLEVRFRADAERSRRGLA